MSSLPWLLLALFSASPQAPPPAERVEVERRLSLMGTEARIWVEGPDREVALAASEVAIRELEAAEARLSTWRAESELSRLNRQPVGEPMALSTELGSELAEAWRCIELTGGAFDPTVGAVLDAWGLRSGGRQPTPEELAAAREASGPALLQLGGGGRAVRHHPGLRIEEGAFGKGTALDRAIAALAAQGPELSATLDLGGQVSFLRPDPGARVAVADPRDRSRILFELEVKGGSVATTGNSERGITLGGRRLGHVFDPRTGEPAPDFGSLTVVASTGLLADCLSTGLYVLGPDAALAWAERHPEVGVLVVETVDGGMNVKASANLAGRIRRPEATTENEPRNEAGSGAPSW
ncbi:MAG TPA: FAD:protein FMN transferase [Thermoanaerobaculia bacterium]|nr:FAD:protein FMN transferase [Thermoanaerobaculia bacterium]